MRKQNCGGRFSGKIWVMTKPSICWKKGDLTSFTKLNNYVPVRMHVTHRYIVIPVQEVLNWVPIFFLLILLEARWVNRVSVGKWEAESFPHWFETSSDLAMGISIRKLTLLKIHSKNIRRVFISNVELLQILFISDVFPRWGTLLLIKGDNIYLTVCGKD